MDAYATVIGRPPSPAHAQVMLGHAKFEQLETFDVDRLVTTGQESIVNGEIDVDRWVSLTMRSAFAGPPREQVRNLAAMQSPTAPAFERAPTSPAGLLGSNTSKIVLAGAVLAVVALVVILVLNGRTTSSGPANTRGTAVVERTGDRRSNEELLTEVRQEFCGQGYESIRLTITRSELHDGTGAVVQPAGSATILENC